jgi:hypothetical protein
MKAKVDVQRVAGVAPAATLRSWDLEETIDA